MSSHRQSALTEETHGFELAKIASDSSFCTDHVNTTSEFATARASTAATRAIGCTTGHHKQLTSWQRTFECPAEVLCTRALALTPRASCRSPATNQFDCMVVHPQASMPLQSIAGHVLAEWSSGWAGSVVHLALLPQHPSGSQPGFVVQFSFFACACSLPVTVQTPRTLPP